MPRPAKASPGRHGLAGAQEETNRQAIVLKNSQGVTLKANTLHDPENHTQPDAVSGSRMVGLEVTKEITLDGQKLPDAPAGKLPQ